MIIYRTTWLSLLAYVCIAIYAQHGAPALLFMPLVAAIWTQAERLWHGEKSHD